MTQLETVLEELLKENRSFTFRKLAPHEVFLVGTTSNLYREAAIILSRIKNQLERISKVQDEQLSGPGKGFDFELLNTLILDVKSLYIWTALISDLFHDRGVVLTEKTSVELKRIAFVRHNFISHFKTDVFQKMRGSHGSILFHAAHHEVQVYIKPTVWNYDSESFKDLVNKCTQYISELVEEQNSHERANLIYQNQSKLPPNLRRVSNEFFVKEGLVTEQPWRITQVLITALKEFRAGFEDKNVESTMAQ